jgi:hypothetical protein
VIGWELDCPALDALGEAGDASSNCRTRARRHEHAIRCERADHDTPEPLDGQEDEP